MQTIGRCTARSRSRSRAIRPSELALRGRKKPSSDEVEAVIANVDLQSMTPRASSWLATLFLMSGAIERCDEVFYRTLIDHPDDLMLNFDFAYALASTKRWPDAIRYYLRCVAIRPDVAGAWRALGNAYRENGEHHRSQESLQRAIELQSNHAPTYIDYAKSLKCTDSFDEMVTAIATAHRLGRPTSESLCLMGEARFGQSKFTEALLAFEQSAELSAKPSEEILEWITQCKNQILRERGDSKIREN